MTDYQRVAELQQMILCELGAAYHAGDYVPYGPSLTSTEAAYQHVADMARLTQEQCRVLCLSSQNALIEMVTVAMGSGNRATVTPREVFRPAIACGATSIIICHNHPSGEPCPSENDVAID